MPTSPLLQPMSFANGTLASNRLWLAPLTNTQSHADGTMSDDEHAWLERRAQGGFGVLVSAATHVTADGQAWVGQLGASDERHLPGWERLARAVRSHGSLLLAQIFHGGGRALRSLGFEPWSASASGEGDGAVRQAAPDDLERVIDAFATAARRLESVGVNGVEVHGAHGYLLSQFLSSTLNRREDEWGGSIEHRARLLRRVVQAVRGAVSPGFVVGVRLSPESFATVTGLDLDETIQVASWLADDGVDFLHLSLWDASRNSAKRPDEHPLPLFRAAVPPRVPLVSAGTLWTRADAERQLELGASAVALGRAAILNPDWPREFEREGFDPRRPPVSASTLASLSVGPAFIDYLRPRPGFIAAD